MDDSSAFLLVGLGFFLTVAILCITIEHYRDKRADRLENVRREWRIAEQREFGFEPVQQSIANQQSFRRFIK